jgi:preprotein translocase subunit SecE
MATIEKNEKKKMAKSAAATNPEDSFGSQVKAWPDRTKSFINDVRNEMKKVNYPSLKEVRATTTVVIITVFLFALYFWAIDAVIQTGLKHLLNLAK